MLSKAELNLSTDALTVEQAIEHALAVYEQNDCNMCGRQHKQLANWLTELLSLREQRAELKALEPVAYGTLQKDFCDEERSLFTDKERAEEFSESCYDLTPLFTAAKPVGLDVEDITEFMRKAFWRGFESARGTENSNIPEHWKDSKPNLLLALKAKISGD